MPQAGRDPRWSRLSPDPAAEHSGALSLSLSLSLSLHRYVLIYTCIYTYVHVCTYISFFQRVPFEFGRGCEIFGNKLRPGRGLLRGLLARYLLLAPRAEPTSTQAMAPLNLRLLNRMRCWKLGLWGTSGVSGFIAGISGFASLRYWDSLVRSERRPVLNKLSVIACGILKRHSSSIPTS